jgi:hypothetical protein
LKDYFLSVTLQSVLDIHEKKHKVKPRSRR